MAATRKKTADAAPAAPIDASDLVARITHGGGVHLNTAFLPMGSFFRVRPDLAAQVNSLGPAVELLLASEIPADLLVNVPVDLPQIHFLREKRAALEKHYLAELVRAKVESHLAQEAAEERQRADLAAERGLRALRDRRIEQARVAKTRAAQLRVEADALEKSSAALVARFGDSPAPASDAPPEAATPAQAAAPAPVVMTPEQFTAKIIDRGLDTPVSAPKPSVAVSTQAQAPAVAKTIERMSVEQFQARIAED